jgi:hypothetical protein
VQREAVEIAKNWARGVAKMNCVTRTIREIVIRFEVFTPVTVKSAVFWGAAS